MKNLLVVLSLLLLFGCGEQTADISNPLSYSKAGLTFNYPGNWTISNDEDLSGIRNIYVDTAGDGIAIVQLYGAADASELKVYAESFAESMAENMPVGEIVDLKSISTPGSSSDEIHESFSIEIMGQKVPHKRQFVLKKFGDQRVYLIFQIATEDEQSALKGFDLIKSSISHQQKK